MACQFCDRLKELRKEHGFTQLSLARQLGKGESTVRMWELGKNQPDHDALLCLAQIFGVSVDYLLGNIDVRHDSAAAPVPPRPALNTLTQLLRSASDEDLEAILRIVRGYLGE